MMGAHGLSEAWGDKGLHRALAAVVLMVLPAFSLLDIALRSPADAMAKVYPGNYFAQMPTLGRRISEISKSEDRIFIFGSEPELFFYARRASATRYILLNPLYGPYSDALERQETAIQDILKAKPAVVVYYPLALFKMPGSKHRFSSWSLNYVQNHGVLDSFLSLDPTGQCHFYCGQDGDSPRLPKDHKYLALVFRVKDLSQ